MHYNDNPSIIQDCRQRIRAWLNAPDTSLTHHKSVRQRLPGTGDWLIQSPSFRRFRLSQTKCLWLQGPSGSGKTILSSTVIQSLRNSLNTQPVLYFYCDFNDYRRQKREDVLRSLTDQLSGQRDDCWEGLEALYANMTGNRGVNERDLSKLFAQMCERAAELWIVLDAVDESKEKWKCDPTLLDWIRDALHQTQNTANFMIASPQDHDVQMAFDSLQCSKEIVLLCGDAHKIDIQRYTSHLIRTDTRLKKWRLCPDVQQEIQSSVLIRLNGVYRLVDLRIDAVAECRSYSEMKRALESLPNTIEEANSRILETVSEQNRPRAVRTLQILLLSPRPLKASELADALSVDTGDMPHFTAKNGTSDFMEFASYCPGLVELTGSKYAPVSKVDELANRPTPSNLLPHPQLLVKLAHSSVKTYLLSGDISSGFRGSLQQSAARATLAHICLTYHLEIDSDMSAEEIRHKYPFAQFASENWIDCVDRKGDDESLLQLMIRFLGKQNEPFRNWSKLYNLNWPLPPNEGKDAGNGLYVASSVGFHRVVSALLKEGADMRAESGGHGTALQAASKGGHLAIVQSLLDAGADINAKSDFCPTALQIAADQDDFAMAQLLTTEGADVEAYSFYHPTALSSASENGSMPIVCLLLDAGAKIDATGEYGGRPLEAASAKGHMDVAKLLIARGADVNAQGSEYGSALNAAVTEGHVEMVKLLVENGADVTAEIEFYGGALEAAVRAGNAQMAKLLIKYGVNPSLPSKDLKERFLTL